MLVSVWHIQRNYLHFICQTVLSVGHFQRRQTLVVDTLFIISSTISNAFFINMNACIQTARPPIHVHIRWVRFNAPGIHHNRIFCTICFPFCTFNHTTVVCHILFCLYKRNSHFAMLCCYQPFECSLYLCSMYECK